jgi:hypothetical protein
MDEQGSSRNFESVSVRFTTLFPLTRSRITARYQREPIRIKKLKNSEVPKPGQLLATFKEPKLQRYRLLSLTAESRKRGSTILAAARGARSGDWTGKASQIVPTPENDK